MTIQGYLAGVADSDLFGTLAIICLVVALSGISARVRERKTHKIMMFVCVMMIPIMHVIGSIYLNQSPA
ncbi:hypothetical protein [Pseudomonas fluorescens]|uniref:Uncharacterized protein n=1 Tax=Pseudomonas fluorescens TaxID=294 RepID=A0A423M5L6_PSEFL|nr:hypothetical protein [Pseudomonas fluorescens]RON77268.1 hypothetical protein BK670_26885 [Pseudomonas fluorescens]